MQAPAPVAFSCSAYRRLSKKLRWLRSAVRSGRTSSIARVPSLSSTSVAPTCSAIWRSVNGPALSKKPAWRSCMGTPSTEMRLARPWSAHPCHRSPAEQSDVGCGAREVHSCRRGPCFLCAISDLCRRTNDDAVVDGAALQVVGHAHRQCRRQQEAVAVEAVDVDGPTSHDNLGHVV